MCGINGIVEMKERDRKELVENMNKTIAHRGPDAKGELHTKNVSLGHLRLSILDLSTKGKQPMHTKDKKKHIVYNGEIYNFKELKEEHLHDYKFHSETDTEVILALYEKMGTDMLPLLNGIFAFAILDEEKNKVLLARDRLGVKPLYIYEEKKGKKSKIIFSSEIKGILATGEVKKEVNEEALHEYLTFQNTFNEKTLFKNINILQPGHYIEINTKNLGVKTGKFWEIDFNKEPVGSKGENFRELLLKAVKRQMISDVPVGTYLSGGFDSTSVTVLAAKDHAKMHTFTGAFKEGGEYDERKYSREVANKANAHLHEILMEPKWMEENMKKIVWHLDEPTKLGRSFAQYYVAKEASKNVTVTLTGHGGDELFAGYPVFLAKLYKERTRKNPLYIIPATFKMLFHSSRKNLLYYYFGPWFNKKINYGMINFFSEKELQKIMKKEKYYDMKKYNPYKTLNDSYNENREENSLQKTMRIYLKHFLTALFVVEDKMSMAHSIESRVPICDNKVVDYALTQSFTEKLKKDNLKNTIKENMKKELPASLYNASKKGFPAPYGKWFKTSLRKYVEEKLLSEESKIKEYFKQKEIRKLLRKPNNFLNEQKIWMLLNLELWMEEYIDE